jgi:hypothetical protein
MHEILTNIFTEIMPKKPVGVHNVNVSKPTSLEGAMNDRVKLKKLEIGAHVFESCFASLQQAHYEHFQALERKHTNIPCKIRQKNVP